MLKLVATAAGGVACGGSFANSIACGRGRSVAAAIETTDPVEKVGCYRLGETGWLYPHRRVCRHGYCWYR